jgi:cyclic pyranopterin phosphate synthase
MESERVELGLPAVRPGSPGAGPPRTGGEENGLLDQFGRAATDMRLSLTDKCNLRCQYCMPEAGLEWLKKDKLLTAAEIVRLVGLGVNRLGVRELRLTGGEPLVRADLVEIIAALRRNHPDLPISLTTNGVGLAKRAQALADAGLTRLNVSMDTLHHDAFLQLTRRPFLDQVLAGIEAASAAGLAPIKINAVLLRGINDGHAAELLQWSLDRGYELRFIEQMPLDADHGWTREGMITAAEMRGLLASDFELSPDPRARDGAPAERFEVRHHNSTELLGTVGIVASVTEPFCTDCRRTRITAEGKVMSCLFSLTEVDLLALLRAGTSAADDDAVANRWMDAMWAKPRAHGMGHPGLGDADFVQPDRSMSAIGG